MYAKGKHKQGQNLAFTRACNMTRERQISFHSLREETLIEQFGI